MSKNIVLFVQSPDKPFATTAEAAEGICDISSPVPSVERAIDAQQCNYSAPYYMISCLAVVLQQGMRCISNFRSS